MKKLLMLILLIFSLPFILGCPSGLPDFSRTVFADGEMLLQDNTGSYHMFVKIVLNPDRTGSLTTGVAGVGDGGGMPGGNGTWELVQKGDPSKIVFNFIDLRGANLAGSVTFYSNREANISVPGAPFQLMGKWYQ